ncbi:hypothetical protein [Agrobacterium sp. NPDC090273]|uniref:hypothetical protein n=1 Tax=Agrobacterium sp. NPDC090273 TaxID=3363919 RepID=UPI00383A2C67
MAVIEAVRTVAQRVSALVDTGVIQFANLDIGLPFYEGNMAASITIPASLCEIAGQNRIAVATTYYFTAREEVTTEGL